MSELEIVKWLRNIEKDLKSLHRKEQRMITPLGGVAIKVTAGETLAEGEVAYIAIGGAGADGKVYKAPADNDMPVGIVYADAATNADCWLVISGIGYVLPKSTITAARGNILYVSASEAGRVDQAATLPAVAFHNREVGHWLDTGTGNGAKTRAIIHWN
jgi:hypothetical protein